MRAFDPERSSDTTAEATLSSPIRPIIVAAFTLSKAYHVKKRDPRSADNKSRKHTELDYDARLEKRTFD